MDAKVHIWFKHGWWYASLGRDGAALTGRPSFRSLSDKLARGGLSLVEMDAVKRRRAQRLAEARD